MNEDTNEKNSAFEDLKKAQDTLRKKISALTERSYAPDIPIKNLILRRHVSPTEGIHTMYEPSLCLIVQGKKRVVRGQDSYEIKANRCLLLSVDLPIISQIVEASPETPYLGLMFKLNLQDTAQMILDRNLPNSEVKNTNRALSVSDTSLPLISAFSRLIDLLEEPRDISMLAPLIQQEIIYRLLTGEQGEHLRKIIIKGTKNQQIARSLQWINQNYRQSIRVQDLAHRANMSNSAFYNSFKIVTTMSPVQYLKEIRLYEARRLMLMEHYDASNASFHVGYESPSQFNREYSRLFGSPPIRDIKKLKEMHSVAS